MAVQTLSETEMQGLAQIAAQMGISFLALFGSTARGEDRGHSDVDLAVRFGRPITLLDLADAQLRFQRLLNRPVDLIPLDSAYPFVRNSIETDLIVLYEDAPDEPLAASHAPSGSEIG